MLIKLRVCDAVKRLFGIPISTGSYCRARMRLIEQEIANIFEHTSKFLQEMEKAATPQERRVIGVDGTGLKAADTDANQNVWPQQK